MRESLGRGCAGRTCVEESRDRENHESDRRENQRSLPRAACAGRVDAARERPESSAARGAEGDERHGGDGEHEVEIRRPNLERGDEHERRRADRGELEHDGAIGARRVHAARRRSVHDRLVDERAHLRLIVDRAGRHELSQMHDDELLARVHPVRRVIGAAPAEFADGSRRAALTQVFDDIEAEAEPLARR